MTDGHLWELDTEPQYRPLKWRCRRCGHSVGIREETYEPRGEDGSPSPTEPVLSTEPVRPKMRMLTCSENVARQVLEV